MRHLPVAVAAGFFFCATAQADNTTVENAVKSRPELSMFYQALQNTGVMHELKEDASYTVFAPTNEAFAKIRSDKYPCFYSAQCKAAVADIVRHHIIPGQVYLDTLSAHQGGVYSMNNRFVTVSEVGRNDYIVDGHNMLSEMMLSGVVLYKIDGVIASDYDLAKVESVPYVTVAGEEKTTTTTEKKELDKVCPAGEECPDAVSTTVTRTTTTVVPPAPSQELAPGR